MLAENKLIDPRLVKAVRKRCDKSELKPETICAFADFLSDGVPFIKTDSAILQSQIALTRGQLEPSLEDDIIEFFGGKNIPNLHFNQDTWRSICALSLKGLDDLGKFLLACEIGIFRINGRDYIFHRAIVTRPQAWAATLRELGNNLHLQVDDFINRIEKISRGLSKGDDVFTSYCRERDNISGEILNPMRDVLILASLEKKYKRAIADQKTAKVQKDKEEGHGAGTLFGNRAAAQ